MVVGVVTFSALRSREVARVVPIFAISGPVLITYRAEIGCIDKKILSSAGCHPELPKDRHFDSIVLPE
jgi:hypothetical protein